MKGSSNKFLTCAVILRLLCVFFLPFRVPTILQLLIYHRLEIGNFALSPFNLLIIDILQVFDLEKFEYYNFVNY